MGSVFNSSISVIDAAWALAVGSIGDGTALSGRAQGYVGTSAASGVVVRATTYTPQGTNAQRSFKSTSASDTSAGTGARTVTINYLDARTSLSHLRP